CSPPPPAGKGWGGGELESSIRLRSPSLFLPRKRGRERCGTAHCDPASVLPPTGLGLTIPSAPGDKGNKPHIPRVLAPLARATRAALSTCLEEMTHAQSVASRLRGFGRHAGRPRA